MACQTIMVQGTTSDAGKSTLVAAMCRVLYRQGVRVAPFKPQNMALNSAVTIDGGEIGRAQALQAQAAGLDPIIDMNPVLLKPTTDVGAQIIIHGQVRDQMNAIEYHEYKTVAMQAVMESYQRLQQQFECIVVEGAGSPAEINLRDRDIANMGFAERVDCPVILIADIDRGGVFAHLVGTLALLSESEQSRIKGFVINRFRGDIKLLQSGLDWLEEYTKKPVLGVLPYLHGLHIDGEDGINPVEQSSTHEKTLRIVVPVLPRISNHTDFDPLRLHPQVDFQYVRAGDVIPPADLVILPGSKNTISDLRFLKENNWQEYLQKHLRYGGKLLGICGGFQMLGEALVDDLGIEGQPSEESGFQCLPMMTHIKPQKQLHQRSGVLLPFAQACSGYEIHAGVSVGVALDSPMVRFSNGEFDGAVSADGQVMGTYLHGIFDEAGALSAVLQWAGLQHAEKLDYCALRNEHIDRLADAAEQFLDWDAIHRILAATP